MEVMRRSKEFSVTNKLVDKARRSSLLSSTSSSLPRYVRLGEGGGGGERWLDGGDVGGSRVRKGYVPVMVGGEGVKERFLIPTQFLGHPSVAALLEMSADEFGFRQAGALQIPCDPDSFREILRTLPFKKG